MPVRARSNSALTMLNAITRLLTDPGRPLMELAPRVRRHCTTITSFAVAAPGRLPLRLIGGLPFEPLPDARNGSPAVLSAARLYFGSVGASKFKSIAIPIAK
jgi:hypothetical protein